MADKGFNIKDLLEPIGAVALNIPPFLSHKVQYNEEEVSPLHIHVKGAMSKIKIFEANRTRGPMRGMLREVLGLFAASQTRKQAIFLAKAKAFEVYVTVVDGRLESRHRSFTAGISQFQLYITEWLLRCLLLRNYQIQFLIYVALQSSS